MHEKQKRNEYKDVFVTKARFAYGSLSKLGRDKKMTDGVGISMMRR